MKTVDRAAIEPSEELSRQLVEIRRWLHQHPELSFQEHQTSAYIAKCLETWGIPYRRVGETGVVVDIVGEQPDGLHIGLRADIDALPIEEQTGLPFASQHPGVMHACGHDGHTTILLGTVYQLYQLRNQLNGRVRCLFQPGEEAGGAAKRLIEQGVLDDPPVDGMLALHLWPHLPFGTVGVRYGAMTAACDDFVIEIAGKGGHCARPHQAVDAIAISGHLLQALSHLSAKQTNPVDPVVVHVGKIQGGTASNVVADHVVLEGTVRTVSPETRKWAKSRLIELAEGIARTYGGQAAVSYADGDPAVINDERLTRAVEESAAELLGREAVYVLKEPSMGADDFGAFAEKVPSTYFRLGINRTGQPCYDLHHPQFQFDDAILPIGVKILTWTVLTRLLTRRGDETC